MIVFAWEGFPQYAARCVGAFVKSTTEKVAVLATRPKVPIEGMEKVAGCPVVWVDGTGAPNQELPDSNRTILFVSGWGVPAFNQLAMQVKASGGRVIAMVDNNLDVRGVRGWLRELGRAIRFRLFLRKRFDGFFVPGKAGRRLLRFYGVKNEKIAEGLYSADETLFRDGGPLAARAKKIIYVGQLIERKNVKRLVRAFQRSLEKVGVDSGWELHLYGSGPLKEELTALADARHGVRDGTVAIHDFLQPEELAAKYREARVFCLPSIEEHWGLVVHEAALSGCALLLSETVGAADDLLDGNGVCFDPFDEDAMVKAFAEVLSATDEVMEQMRVRSLELAGERGLRAFVGGVRKLILV